MSAHTKPVLLEREAELDELQTALQDAGRGVGRLVVVEGAAGIGKTRLLESARESAERTGMWTLSARGTELERDFPFGLVRQLFEPTMHRASAAERHALLDEAARLAGPIVGIESRMSAERDGVGHLTVPSFAILNALYWLTSNLAQGEPLLIAVDDAHWSDQATLRFLLFLLPRLEDLPVALVLTARVGEVGAEWELLSQLSADPAARVLGPSELGRNSVAELVRAELGSGAADPFCAACHEATGGNPFLLQELLLELRAECDGTEAEAARVRELAPASIRRAVLARLGRLADPSQALARAVAVLGDDAEPQQAAALAGVDTAAAARAADALAAAGVLEAGRPLRFAHPLLRNAVYADLSSAAKFDSHRMAADLLEAAGAGPERIAVHLLATDPRRDRHVVKALEAAALRALEHGAPEAAVAYVRRALVEPPEPSVRPDLLHTLMTASLFSMDASLLSVDHEALDDLHLDLLGELTGQRQTLFAAAAELAPLLHISDRRGEAVSLLESATAAAIKAGDYDLVMRFQAQIVLWGWLLPGNETNRWVPHEARIAPGTPGERLLLMMKAYTGYGTDQSAARVSELARRAVEGGAIFREQRDLLISAMTVLLLIRADELGAAEDAIEHYSRAAEARGPAPIIATAWMRGELAYARGQIAQAEPYARAAVEVARQKGFLVGPASLLLALLIDILIERDALDAAEHELEMTGYGGLAPIVLAMPLKHSRGCLLLAQGRTREGLKDLLEVAKRAKHVGFKNPVLPTGAIAAIAFASAGEAQAARASAESYRRSAERWGTSRVKGIALHCQGIVEGGEPGIELLREAVAVLRRSPARLELARALTDLGAALRRANRRAEARGPLREALDMARREGALAVAGRAHDELEATGERLRPLLASGLESLTPSERRVAAMAAKGKSNRAIAQELFLTVKTIEAHLSSAYRKLDIGSRSELPEALGIESRESTVPPRL
jgi:DNA-binding CsgD family transcriptional regulator